MLQFSHPNTFWLFPAFLQNSVLPRLGFASKYMKNNLDTFVIQCCAKEMRANFAEISANKLRTFVSDENSAKFWSIYCSSPYEISEATCIKVSCTVQWNWVTIQQFFILTFAFGPENLPDLSRNEALETVDSFFRYCHAKHGSLGSNFEMPSQ